MTRAIALRLVERGDDDPRPKGSPGSIAQVGQVGESSFPRRSTFRCRSAASPSQAVPA